jgi:hypothetical protein
MNKLI